MHAKKYKSAHSKPHLAEAVNPYMSARRSWNDQMQTLISSRQVWQIMGILSMLVALVSVAGIIHIGQQSKFIPYVIEVDKLGQTAAVSLADKAAPADPRVIAAALSTCITKARLVTPDVVLQRNAVFDVYAMLPANAPATQKMTDFYNGTEESSPFKRAANEMVSTEISSAMALTPETWQVDWLETTRDRQGAERSAGVHAGHADYFYGSANLSHDRRAIAKKPDGNLYTGFFMVKTATNSLIRGLV